MTTQLYNLFDYAESLHPTYVLTASLRIVEEYLGAQVPRTFRKGRVVFTVNHMASTDIPRHLRVGTWLVVEHNDRRGEPQPKAKR